MDPAICSHEGTAGMTGEMSIIISLQRLSSPMLRDPTPYGGGASSELRRGGGVPVKLVQLVIIRGVSRNFVKDQLYAGIAKYFEVIPSLRLVYIPLSPIPERSPP